MIKRTTGKITELFNGMSLKYKLLLCCIAAIIPMFAVSMMFMLQSYRSIDDAINVSRGAVLQLAGNIRAELTQLYNVSDILLADRTLREYVSTVYTDDYSSYYDYISKVQPILNTTANYHDVRLTIYSDNNTLNFSRITNNSIKDALSARWYLGMPESSGAVWTSMREPYRLHGSESYTYYYGYYRAATLVEKTAGSHGNISMLMLLMLPERRLYSLISQEAANGKIIYVCDPGGNVITSTERKNVQQNIADITGDRGRSLGGIEEKQTVRIGGVNYIAIRESIAGLNLTRDIDVLYLMPLEMVSTETYRLLIGNVALSALFLLLSLMIAFWMSRRVSRRIYVLSGSISEVWEKGFDTSIPRTGNDEIGVLEENFDALIKKINTLINEVYLSELKVKELALARREAEIKALQQQINPHYLFNTIEAIKMGLLLGRDKETLSEVLTAFGESFRVFVDARLDKITLREEMEFLTSYIVIQQYIFDKDLDVDVKVSGDALDAMIPRLILQPLVENAVYHGIMPKGRGRIEITVERTGGRLAISVADDGAGMDDETLSLLNRYVSDDAIPLANEKIALKNVLRRLKLLYGEDCSMSVGSAKGVGTTVRISVPYVTAEESEGIEL